MGQQDQPSNEVDAVEVSPTDIIRLVLAVEDALEQHIEYRHDLFRSAKYGREVLMQAIRRLERETAKRKKQKGVKGG